MKNRIVVSIRSTIAREVNMITHTALIMFDRVLEYLRTQTEASSFKKFIIKQLVNSVFAFCYELSNLVSVLFTSAFCFGLDNSCSNSSNINSGRSKKKLGR